MDIKISIIVPIYNVELYLERCIHSILNQSFSDFELILVNDGSTDGSLKICNEYSKVDSRIKVIDKKNGGLSSARNAGIEASQGEYIGFIDSDDYINKDMYKVLYNNIVKTNSDISIVDFKYVYEQDRVYSNDNVKNEDYIIFNDSECINQLHSKYNIQFVVAWNKLYKRELFKELRYKEGRIHEDEFIIHRLLYKTKKVVYTPMKLHYYLQRKDSITKSDFNLSRLDSVYAINDRLEFYREKKLYDLEFKAHDRYISLFFNNYYKAKILVNNCGEELKQLKKEYNNNLIYILKNSYYSWKEKTIFILFFINPKLYELYKKIKGIELI